MHSQSQTLTPVPFHSAKGGRGSKGKETITEGKGERKNQETDGARKETPNHPNPRSKTASESSSADDDDDASSDDDIFGETRKQKRRRVLDDDDDNDNDDDDEISDKIADDTNTTTIADDAETKAHRGGNVVTPRRFHAGHGTLQEAGVDRSGNSTLLHELHSRTSLTHLVSQYNTI